MQLWFGKSLVLTKDSAFSPRSPYPTSRVANDAKHIWVIVKSHNFGMSERHNFSVNICTRLHRMNEYTLWLHDMESPVARETSAATVPTALYDHKPSKHCHFYVWYEHWLHGYIWWKQKLTDGTNPSSNYIIKNNSVRYGLNVVFVYLFVHQTISVSPLWRIIWMHRIYNVYVRKIISNVCLGLSPFSQSPFVQYMGSVLSDLSLLICWLVEYL